MKKLYKSKKNKVFAGVVGGVGEYFDVDPVILRLTWLLVVVFTGFVPGVVVYIISIFVVPNKLSRRIN
ncbi:MAG: PspC domain-containing protein [Patescibacteria group bacterium]|nr:PspC domain-containing protein [Patescibacteria group bacterium]